MFAFAIYFNVKCHQFIRSTLKKLKLLEFIVVLVFVTVAIISCKSSFIKKKEKEKSLFLSNGDVL